MSRELIVKIKCDFCNTQVEEEYTTSGEVVLNTKHYTIDLCPSCAGELTPKLIPRAQSLATVTKKSNGTYTPSSQKTIPCPACGHLCKNELGVNFHIKKMHPGSSIN